MRAIALVKMSALILTVAFSQPNKNLQTLKGKIVPNFQLRDLNGKVINFSQFRSKVLLLNFWSPH